MKRKIAFSLGILILIIFIQGIFCLAMLFQVRASNEEMNSAGAMHSNMFFIEMSHYNWVYDLMSSIYTGAKFEKSLDPEACPLGEWLDSDEVKNSSDAKLIDMTEQIRKPHDVIHNAAKDVIFALDAKSKAEAISVYEDKVLPNMEFTINKLDEINNYTENIMQEKAQQEKSIFNFVAASLLFLLIISIISGIILLIRLVKKIVPPVQALTRAAGDLANGNVDIEISFTAEDEMKDLAVAFQTMANEIRMQARVMEKISHGDYTVDMPVHGENDIMNIAINHMLEENNKMMNELKIAAEMVSDGAMEIADRAQTLSVGSSDQFLKLGELFESVKQVEEKAQENSDLAGKSMDDVLETRKLMRDSIEYMKDMNFAMETIDAGSRGIAKVINLIEDIAFQTNILSLNTAVEAARAGQHGKGFAAVADEVRNLANKSAKAAEETAELIDESILNVEKGTEIAEKTTKSLIQVGEIAENNAEAIGKTSNASKEQTDSIIKITKGLKDVAEVVEANSSISKENAASSEELSGQSDALKSIVSRFKLISEIDIKDKKR